LSFSELSSLCPKPVVEYDSKFLKEGAGVSSVVLIFTRANRGENELEKFLKSVFREGT